MDMMMIQQLMKSIGETLPKYFQSLETDFEKENGSITEEQRKVFEFVQKKANEFMSQMNLFG
jgi:hypothetical protein